MATNYPVVFTRLSTPSADQPATNAEVNALPQKANGARRDSSESCTLTERIKTALTKR